MQSPARAMAWQFLLRYRPVLWGGGLYLALLMFAYAVIDRSAWSAEAAAATLLPLVFLLLFLLAVFSYSHRADIFVTDSAFPAYMFRLPVTSRALAGWPMLIGVGTLLALWSMIALFVMPPALAILSAEINQPLRLSLGWTVFIAVALAALLAWLQAVLWATFPVVLLRAVAAITVIGGIAAVAIAVGNSGFSPWPVTLLFAASLPLAYLSAVVAVDRSRHGDVSRFARPISAARGASKTCTIEARRFASPAAAQQWWEYCRFVPLTFWLTAGLVVGLVLLVMFDGDRGVNPLIILAVPPYIACFISMLLGSVSLQREQIDMSPFLAARPLSSAGFVAAKMRTAVIACSLSCGVALLGLIAVLLIIQPAEPWVAVWRHLTARLNAMEIAVLIVFVPAAYWMTTWLLAAQGLFVKLSGRRWIEYVMACVVGGGITAVVVLPLYVYSSPQWQTTLLTARPYAPFLWGSLIAIKLALAIYLTSVLSRRGLVAGRTLLSTAGAWMAVWAVVTAVAAWLVPGDIVPWYEIAAGAALLLPANRLLVAPLAVDSNRHR